MLRDLTHIPLDRLQPSRLNVRRHGAREIEALAASIGALGLLHPLLVRTNGDRFEIIAGERRYLAIKRLATEGASRMPTVPCVVMEETDDAFAIEASLAENIARLPMDDLDQFEAFAALAKRGLGEREIARYFAVPVAIVKRRLAIAKLNPGIRRLYRQGEIDRETLELLTLASRSRQEAWLDLRRDPNAKLPPPWQLKSWLLGGAEISAEAALFEETSYQGSIVADLFGKERYFTDPEEFWRLQNAAIAAERERLLASGWSAVHIIAPDVPFDAWALEKVSKAQGGAVYIEVEANGCVTVHKGLAPRQAEVGCHDDRETETHGHAQSSLRPELSGPLANYCDLVRHGAVRLALAKSPMIALRVMLAHILGGGRLWKVEPEPRRPATEAIGTALEALPSQAAYEAFRREALALLGDSDDDALVAPSEDGQRTARLFDHLNQHDDAKIMQLVAVVMAETLAAGTGFIDALGATLEVDIAHDWQPDDTFFALVRDREAISGMLAEVAGERTAAAHLTATGTAKKAILRKALGSNARPGAGPRLPRYMRFPSSGYTGRPMIAGAGTMT